MNATNIVSAPARIAAIGCWAPAGLLTNADLERMVDTSDEWILRRTGIRRRHKVGEGEYASTVAFGAIDDLFSHNPQYTIRDVDYIIAGSSTADYAFPSLSAMVQAHYKMPLTVGAVDISTACAGFTYGLNLAAGLIASGQAERVLVVVGDALTRTIDYTDRATCVLFGDGGGAALLERSEKPAIFGMYAGSDGTAGAFLYRTAVRQEVNGVIDSSRLVRQEGASIYRWVMENIPDAIESVLKRAGVTLDDIDWFVPHSANARMIEALDHRLPFPIERTLLSIEEYGNTSGASIPLALTPAVRDGRVRPGDKLLLMGFGGGLVLAGNVVHWSVV
jgi:3-oxoacyl-[acyl-carrier-protein] synthase III